MRVTGRPEEIVAAIEEHMGILAAVQERILHCKRQIDDWQAAALFLLARPHNWKKSRLLDIGTAQGFSAAVLAEACPDSLITTLNVKDGEFRQGLANLKAYQNVEAVWMGSWDYLTGIRYTQTNRSWGMIFVDGDHNKVRYDLPWFNEVASNGLILFHDYSPLESRRPCPPVYEELNMVRGILGREFDVELVDETGVGMAGFYRRPGEHLPETYHEIYAMVRDDSTEHQDSEAS